MPLLLCPNCNVSMQNVARSGVELDMCPSCRGVWLDRGELEKILEGGREVRQADVQARERFDREIDTFHRDPDDWKRSHPYDGEAKRHRYDDDDYHHRKKKRGFDIFDIFD
ncbi:zf-TFIIB domain-containing protein [Phenylobacterium sp.]|uniref:TFIIB-type zinc ribbon-containing protein n=1 Tax=Phenylobacterium sp. TaxID=1871053 RepID=UPI00273616C8|nr:zf-TFIIB domain-containing protein [Phenylobacterium sp.]MDP3852083.1 zf-TFIIB domain-containing protein [Phenylobacterium sp.]